MNYATLPNPAMAEGLQGWFEQGIPVGDFLTAVLSNNLRESFGRADHINVRCLHQLVQWLYWEAPATSWGSAENVEAWGAIGGLAGMQRKHEAERAANGAES